ncbi:hypothetical protein M378DRAFT_170838 [Amanita muscaria Koide BX008]|uniref:Uncharacterized protein n=1 Tax=Amanita muscaria (strain Koide BX008) TaxID=946122 RepID=A0A0C2WPR9_AMAMK|nr:hypothetical protein M378DRAFT_170838 [Amanita muscaria Koide BX008]
MKLLGRIEELSQWIRSDFYTVVARNNVWFISHKALATTANGSHLSELDALLGTYRPDNVVHRSVSAREA